MLACRTTDNGRWYDHNGNKHRVNTNKSLVESRRSLKPYQRVSQSTISQRKSSNYSVLNVPRSCSSNWAAARLADSSENTRTEENKKLYWSNSQKARNKREVHSSQVQLDTKGKIGKSFFSEQAVFCLWKVENWGWLRFFVFPTRQSRKDFIEKCWSH